MTEDEINYNDAVAFLLEGIQTGRLRITGMKKTRKTQNSDQYTIIVLDTAIPTRKKTTKKVINKDKKEEQKEQKPVQKEKKSIKAKSDPVPVAPNRPVMCAIERIS